MSREFKGKSLLSLEDDYVVVDLETTGLDPRCDEIIEVGAIKVVGGQPCDRFESLCRPDCEISEFITQLTGITSKMLDDAPTISDVLPPFLRFVGNSVVVGHNVNFDINFLYDACLMDQGVLFSNNFVDTMRLAKRSIKGLPHYRLSDLVDALNLPSLPAHRGLSDCESTYMCYEALKKYVIENKIDLAASSYNFYDYFKIRAKDIKPQTDHFDESHFLFQKVCVFTGILEKYTRREAMQLVADHGGICGDSITKKTNYLIVGNFDYLKCVKNGKSTKIKKAEQYILAGQDIQIISESVFYDMLEE